MSTKLIAAELATAAGVTTVIMHSEKAHDIFAVIEEGVGPSREVSETPRLEEGPLCTRFLRRESAMNECVVPITQKLIIQSKMVDRAWSTYRWNGRVSDFAQYDVHSLQSVLMKEPIGPSRIKNLEGGFCPQE
jgi:hypothetical protein